MRPSCPVCGSARVGRSFVRDGVPYFTCPECSFRFGRPAHNANIETALSDYEDVYLQYLGPDPADEANFTALRAWIDPVRPLEGGSVLDVGTGSGKWVRWLRAQGLDAWGLEPAEALYGRFLAGEPELFQRGFVPSYEGPKPDVVTAFDVLEHVEDPSAFLGEIAELLGPGGHLFVSTPDRDSLLARVLGRRWHFYNRYHLSLFSSRTLERAASDAGFELLECRHLGRRRSIGYALRHFVEFTLRRRLRARAGALDRVEIPINLFDVMLVAMRRR